MPVLFTVAVMALAVSLEPYRVGMTVAMLSRSQPLRQLLAFLSGGLLMGMTVGLGVLFVVRTRVPKVSGYFTLAGVQLLLGSLLMAVAAVLTMKGAGLARGRRDAGGSPTSPTSPTSAWASSLITRARRWLARDTLWIAGGAGLGIGLPSADYLAVLAVILASEAAAAAQIGALVVFHLVAFGLVELPLLAYVFAPRATLESMTRVNRWIRARRHFEVAAVLGLLGAVLLTLGVTAR